MLCTDARRRAIEGGLQPHFRATPEGQEAYGVLRRFADDAGAWGSQMQAILPAVVQAAVEAWPPPRRGTGLFGV